MRELFETCLPYLFAFAAIICFFSAFVMGWREKIKAAALFSTLFLLCAVLAHNLDSIDALGVVAKFHKDVDRAEENLKQLKELTIVNAKTSYMVLAWQNRMGSSSAKNKQAILDGFEQLLSDLKVDSSERERIAYPYTQMIGLDLYSNFIQVLDKYINWKRDNIVSKHDPNMDKPESRTYDSETEKWRKKVENPLSPESDYDLNLYLTKITPEKLFDAHEKELVDRFREELVRIYNDCKHKGGLTPEAVAYFDKYINSENGSRVKTEELFDVSQVN